ncbi:hypothetical protein KPL47_18840 [Clostridium estertheticum]|uniref:hypothetical protein n=1 Tax=Clostridium estertheticum TaxID=238834 RepID=UPI001C0B83B3|nr:hypothetical protein [Clostridium estertheticum]MBU3178385.1 hypothetical protein [Clostridium estertheticum]
MKTLEFVPYKSIGMVNFGMLREEVRQKLGEYYEFKKTEFSKNTTDDFRFVHAYYDENNRLEAVECFEEAKIIFDNVDMMALNTKQLKAFLGNESIEYIIDESGLQADSVGISAYIPDIMNNKEAKVETLLLFKKGYYD